jgi:hypothetical protein
MSNSELIERDNTETLPVRQPEQQHLNPLVAAVLGGQDIDPEKLDKLLALQERYEANEAKKAYTKAMADFRKEAPTIEKNKEVSFNNTKYRHTQLGYALSTINPILGKHGFNPSWTTEQKDGQITVTCTMTHSQGHREKTSLSAAPDASGGKNSIQAIGSTVSYLQRYTLFSICGLASSDQDDDGLKSEKEEIAKITEEQATQIHALISENGLNKDKFLQWLRRGVKAESIENINVNAFDSVVRQIKASIEAHKNADH